MTGLVLEGGGSKGSYQAGVYMAMYECGIKIDGVVGTSIGALNGAIIASNRGSELPKIWRSISIGNAFGIPASLVDALNKKKVSFNLIKLSITSLIGVVDNHGFSMNGIRDIITKYVDVEAIYQNEMEFGICTVRSKDLEPLYLFKEDMSKDKFVDYLLASAYLPIFKKQRLIDDGYYLDGGFYDLGPVNMLLEAGYDKIYLIKNKGPGIRRKYPENSNVIVIEATRDLGNLIELNKDKIKDNITIGYYDAIRVLKNYDGYKYVFKRHDELFYEHLTRGVSKNLVHRVLTFFDVKTIKEATIKALEYVMEHENISYNKIYKIKEVLKMIPIDDNNHNFIYKYVLKLK